MWEESDFYDMGEADDCGCLKCSNEDVYRDGLCRRHHNIEKILSETN